MVEGTAQKMGSHIQVFSGVNCVISRKFFNFLKAKMPNNTMQITHASGIEAIDKCHSQSPGTS